MGTDTFHTLRHTMEHRVLDIIHLTDSTYILRSSRDGMDFIPGQHLSVGPKNDLNMREYSVYSGKDDDYLDILVKEIPQGQVSKELKKLQKGDAVKIEGPFGAFIIEEEDRNLPLYMLATGTGISPYHCFSLSYPELNFTVLHGVKTAEELYEKEYFDKPNITYIPCLSQERIEALKDLPYALPFQGRVTAYLLSHQIEPSGVYFLCGNCDMIYEAFDILQKNGVSPENIRAEVYF